MKRIELVVAAILIIALAIRFAHLPGGSVLITLSLSLFAVLYMYFSFGLFNGIRFRKMFKKASYANITTMRIVGSVMVGLALAILMTGILFKVMSWPGAGINLLFGLVATLIGGAVAAVKLINVKAPFYQRVLKRVAVWGTVGSLLLLAPGHFMLRLDFRNDPELLEAHISARTYPDSLELWNRVDSLEADRIQARMQEEFGLPAE